jgi:hypothetical protein
MHLRAKRLTHCLKIATKILPQGQRRDPVVWWHKDIDDAAKVRDLLESEAHLCDDNRKQWVEACQEVVKLIKLRRLEYWKDFNTKNTWSINSGKTAAVLRSLNREQRISTNVALVSAKG